jgi:competence protein ComEC
MASWNTRATSWNRRARLLCLALCALLLAGCTVATDPARTFPPADTARQAAAAPPSATAAPPSAQPGQTLEVHFIDVGQADSILVRQGGAAMLIDAGNNPDGPDVVSYLRSQGVTQLDTLVGTHPHEDHIGGLDTVLYALQTDRVIMPKVAHTTKTFKDVIDAIEAKNLKVTTPVPGQTFALGDASCTVLAPQQHAYDDLNNYSVVLRVTFGGTAFLFTGDAEALSEKEMLSGGQDLRADVLKVGHHGSASSTTAAFMRGT